MGPAADHVLDDSRSVLGYVKSHIPGTSAPSNFRHDRDQLASYVAVVANLSRLGQEADEIAPDIANDYLLRATASPWKHDT